jgi:hypothetical protein
MFAPLCPSCRRRVLLGPRRIVQFSSGDHGHEVVLRCYCGTLVDSDAVAPVAEQEAAS